MTQLLCSTVFAEELTDEKILSWLIDGHQKSGVMEQNRSTLADEAVLAVLAGRCANFASRSVFRHLLFIGAAGSQIVEADFA